MKLLRESETAAAVTLVLPGRTWAPARSLPRVGSLPAALFREQAPACADRPRVGQAELGK